MILTGNEIAKGVESGDIIFHPFAVDKINPNSIDLTLGRTLLRYVDAVLDPAVESQVEEIEIPDSGLILPRHGFHLGCSAEVVGSTKFVPLVHAKSSIARAGLFVHVTADLIDIGSVGTITFQLFSTLSFKIYPGMRLGQMTFWRTTGDILLYNGKYQNSSGPRKSMVFLDRFWQERNEHS